MVSSKKGDGKDSPIGDVIKKVVSIGVGAAFMTEDAVKNALSDLPLPKDIVSGLLANAKGAKDDFLRTMRDEIHERLTKVNVSQLVEEVLDKYDLDVKASVSFRRKSPPKGE